LSKAIIERGPYRRSKLEQTKKWGRLPERPLHEGFSYGIPFGARYRRVARSVDSN